MGIIHLRPLATPGFGHPGPSDTYWTRSDGGKNHADHLNDDNDTTYLTTFNQEISPTDKGPAYFNLAPSGGLVLPEGARVRTMRTFVRARKTLDGQRTVTADLDVSLNNPQRPGDTVGTAGGGPGNRIGGWHNANNQHTVTRNATTFYGAPTLSWYDGSAISQTKLNSMLVGLPRNNKGSGNKTRVRVYELGVEVEYDERPNATAGTSGTFADTSSPLLTWGYDDDFEPQEAYEVEIYDDLGALAYTSGIVESAQSYHQVTGALPPGDYTWRVRAAQRWVDRPQWPHSRFWSVWSASLAFTIETIAPASPSLVASDGGHRIQLDVLSGLNLMPFTAAHFENGALPALGGFSSTSGLNYSAQPSAAHTGGVGLRLDVTSSATVEYLPGNITSAIRARILHPGTEHTAYVWVRNSAGETARNAHVVIDWWSDALSLGTDTVGGTVALVQDAWNQLTVTGVAPAGATWAKVGVVFESAVSGDAYDVDDFTIYLSDVAHPSPVELGDASRGGVHAPTELLNALAYVNSTVGAAHNWAAANANTEVEVSAAQGYHGDTSLLVTRTGSTGTAAAALSGDGLVEVPDGFSFAIIGGAVYSPVSSRNVSFTVEQLDNDLNVIDTRTEVVGSSVGAWRASLGLLESIEAETRYVRFLIGVSSAVAGEEHYIDALRLGFTNSSGNGVKSQNVDGAQDYDGPHTEVEYSEDGGTTWEEFTTQDIPATSASLTLYDHEVQPGVSRVYRARNYATIDGQFLVSPWSTVTDPETVTLLGIWLNVRGPLGLAPDSEYNFVFDAGRSESIEDGGTSMHFAGRKYAVSEWGEEQARSFACNVHLPARADVDAFKALARARALLVYRDARGNRGVGRITGPSINYEPGAAGWSATFTFELQGEQIGSLD